MRRWQSLAAAGGWAAPQQQIPGFIGKPIEPPPMHIPDGFTPIFNGKDLSGWHISKTNHHGVTPDFHVLHGLIVATQNPLGGGGILLTDKKYRNVEIYMEVKPDWGCDSGLFLRSSEAGDAYQVTMDYLPGGTVGGMYGEGLQGVSGRGSTRADWTKVWKREDWNTVRARIEGDVPHIQAWINDQQVLDFTDTANHAIGGITEGPIGIQVHGAGRWVPGGFWRWRVIAIKEIG
jgi:3-keto-disaccharide hydrolase